MSMEDKIIDLTIPSSREDEGVVYYDIEVKLPYKKYTVSRRFKEFQTLKQNLEILRMNTPLPYLFPSKFNLLMSNDKVVANRKLELTEFLNNLIHDHSLRSSPLLMDFLSLPKTIFMTEHINVKENWLNKEQRVDIDNWISHLKNVNNTIKNITTKIFNNVIENNEARSEIFSVRRELEKLTKSLASDEKSMGSGELRRRSDLLALAKREFQELESLVNDRTPTQTTNISGQKLQLLSSNRRVLGKLRETADTLPLNNNELYLQQQLQLNRQEQDIDQLRSIIHRQKEIATVINDEVMEQNEMLDGLTQHVDESDNNMRTARKMIRKIR